MQRTAVSHKMVALILGAVLSGPLILGCGGADRGEKPPPSDPGSATRDDAAKTERQPLAAVEDPADAKGKTLSVSRVTVGAGDVLDLHFHEGEQTSRIEKGTLTYTVEEGEVPVYRGSPEGGRQLVREISAGETADIEPGQWVIEEQGDVHAARNRRDVPVEIVLTSLLRTGAPAATPATARE